MLPTEIHSKNVLLSPLNWGFGHVSRCIPLINHLLEYNNSIFIACDTAQKSVFIQYFGQKVKFIEHQGYPFQFSGKGNYTMDLFFSIVKLLKRSKNEFKEVESYIKEFNIDFIISDHRYSFRSKMCYSIFMTHQLNLPISWFQFPFKFYHKKQIKKFDSIWIVDKQENSLAGKLSENKQYFNAKHIGYLSRFMLYPKKKIKNVSVLIISGPKEYWANLFLAFSKELESNEIQTIVGSSDVQQLILSKKLNQKFHSSNNWLETDELLLSTKKMYGYIGYTTLMDVEILNCDSYLIASPGQLEQEYLKKIRQKKSRTNPGFN
jgi:spore coat polysaccharide biosynthesis predicted glycosyltransferase SpsG